VALHANGLSSRLRDDHGLPSPFWRRQILREGDIVDALSAVTATPRSGSTNIVLSHRDGFAVNVETWPRTARWLHPENGWLVHTNHYLAGIPPQLAETYNPSADSILRYGRASQLLAEAAVDGISESDLKAMLRDHLGGGNGICTHADPGFSPDKRWETVASVITDLTTGVFSVSAGPPCSNHFTRIEISTGKVIDMPRPAALAG
jgi:isopenicillin-N N-acyltransferase-like protein